MKAAVSAQTFKILILVLLVSIYNSLFFDKRLSNDNSISCSGCHNLANGGTDNLQFSIGVNGATGKINTPTVYNTHLNLA